MKDDEKEPDLEASPFETVKIKKPNKKRKGKKRLQRTARKNTSRKATTRKNTSEHSNSPKEPFKNLPDSLNSIQNTKSSPPNNPPPPTTLSHKHLPSQKLTSDPPAQPTPPEKLDFDQAPNINQAEYEKRPEQMEKVVEKTPAAPSKPLISSRRIK